MMNQDTHTIEQMLAPLAPDLEGWSTGDLDPRTDPSPKAVAKRQAAFDKTPLGRIEAQRRNTPYKDVVKEPCHDCPLSDHCKAKGLECDGYHAYCKTISSRYSADDIDGMVGTNLTPLRA